MTIRSIKLAGEEVPLTVRLSARAKRMKVRVEATRSLTLILPSGVQPAEGIAFLRQEQDWLLDKLGAVASPVLFEPGAILPIFGTDHVIIHTPEKRGTVARQDGEIRVSGDRAHLPRRIRDWAYREIRQVLTERVDVHTDHLNVRRGRLSIRDQKSRWGSCSSKGNLNFSWRLIFMPEDVVDYIAAHEVAHLVHLDHSPAFWKLTRSLCPHMKEAEAWLKKHGASVHRYSGT